ncbi:diguanylate cyclase [Marinomonas ostreistagni]|uniref:diguanylate cyclase n=1 Tax=Marinomonas ostreistagni TaxID=359209 RepID=A0ABS0Z991_9GAMM|nr:diguanylate cyclase [Marinomonas ostreistagni]MBJ7550228.1 diguanylate cyclase [Marinomonas ostreistagni]
MQTFDFQNFVSALDTAQQAHFEWSQRILRCAVLHTRPQEDMMRTNAHHICLFGQFLDQHKIAFYTINTDRAEQLFLVHKQMHDAIRSIAIPISKGKPGNKVDLDEFETSQAAMLDHLAYFKTNAIHQYTQIDSLTGLPLRQRLTQDFEAKKNRGNWAVGLMFMDVDHFKAINDLYGHSMGDRVLQHLVKQTHSLLEPHQSMYRYGGEEFVVVSNDLVESYDALELAEQIRASLFNTPVEIENGDTIPISVTIGVAIASEGEPLANLIERADHAMYLGKKQGRNRVIHLENLN